MKKIKNEEMRDLVNFSCVIFVFLIGFGLYSWGNYNGYLEAKEDLTQDYLTHYINQKECVKYKDTKYANLPSYCLSYYLDSENLYKINLSKY